MSIKDDARDLDLLRKKVKIDEYNKKRVVNYIPLLPMISMNLLSGPNTIVSTLSVPVF